MTSRSNLQRTVGALVFGLGLAVGVGAQESGGQAAPPPAKVDSPTNSKSAEQWIQDLGSDSYRTRVEAESQLRSIGQGALSELRKAAKESADPEVQWRARRLVRQIERGDADTLGRRSSDAAEGPQPTPQSRRPMLGWVMPGFGQDGIRERFEQMFGQIERDFGIDIHRSRFFEDGFFQELEEQMQALGNGVSQGMTLQVGPDGAVRAEVKSRGSDGEVETKVYEAPDMQSFREQYPDVLGKNGLAPGFQFWVDGAPRDVFPFRAGPFERLAPGAVPAPELPPAGKRLGVSVRPAIPAELREHLELREGLGLMVESVQPGTLAAALGLQKGDIVVRIGEREIASTADVQDALGAIADGADVVVAFVRRGAEQSATTKKVADAEPQPAAKERKLEPRGKDARRGVR